MAPRGASSAWQVRLTPEAARMANERGVSASPRNTSTTEAAMASSSIASGGRRGDRGYNRCNLSASRSYWPSHAADARE